MSDKKMTYAGSGVNYDLMDPFKIAAQLAAEETASNLICKGISEVKMSRGESVYLIEFNDFFLAHVEEGLGTKNLVADAMYKLTGKSFYDQIAQDTIAMIFNDMITLGALPISVAMHLATGDSDWFKDKQRWQDLIDGWKYACNISKCAWGCGETPTLKGIVYPETCLLSGSAIGIVKPKNRLFSPSKIKDFDAIVLIESSGIHANGLTSAREIADKLPQGYLTKLEDGRNYGESLLDPTIIYVPLIEACLKSLIDIHYTANITGHGWRKLMRAPESFSYIIENIPEPQLVFKFIQEHGPVSEKEMYANFNMGTGFAIYLPNSQAGEVISKAKKFGMNAIYAGYIRKSSKKKVVIKPKKLTYSEESLAIR